MMDRENLETLLLAIVCATIFGLLAARCDSSAQDAPARPRISDQLMLARICASEQGLRTDVVDCAAIHSVLSRGAARRGLSFASYARAYSSRVFDTSRRDERAYLAFLRPDGREPQRWPETVLRRRRGVAEVVPHVRWGAVRSAWLELHELAGRIVRGEVAAQCSMPADHWGCPPDPWRACTDHDRAVRAGWDLVDCGDTLNEFWSVPAFRDVD